MKETIVNNHIMPRRILLCMRSSEQTGNSKLTQNMIMSCSVPMTPQLAGGVEEGQAGGGLSGCVLLDLKVKGKQEISGEGVCYCHLISLQIRT
jgi:hypothetical protein